LLISGTIIVFVLSVEGKKERDKGMKDRIGRKEEIRIGCKKKFI
jgi:hypothetical protein